MRTNAKGDLQVRSQGDLIRRILEKLKARYPNKKWPESVVRKWVKCWLMLSGKYKKPCHMSEVDRD